MALGLVARVARDLEGKLVNWDNEDNIVNYLYQVPKIGGCKLVQQRIHC